MKTFKQLIENEEEWLGTDNHNTHITSIAKDNLLKIHPKHDLEDLEHESMHHYSEYGYIPMNESLRNETSGPDDLAIHHLNNAINKHTTEHHAHLWRGISSKAKDLFNNVNPGDIFHDKGFVSTTFNPTLASIFGHTGSLIHIKVPKGSKALYRDHYHKNASEREVILPKNSKFRYEGHEVVKDKQGVPIKLHHLTHIPEGHE
jgi:hypothetical protein